MSFVTNAKIITARMSEKNLRHYQVFDNDGKSLIDESPDEGDFTVQDSINSLSETLDNINGIVYIVIRGDNAARKRTAKSADSTETADKYKGIYKYTLKLGEAANGNNNNAGMGSNFMLKLVIDSMQSKFDAQLKSIEDTNRIKAEYEARFAQLEKKIDKGSNSSMPPELINLFKTMAEKLSK